MKEKRVLFNVSILALIVWVAGLGLTPYAMAHSIGDVVMVPKAPAGLLDGEPVTVRFSYETEEQRGVRIYAIPYTKGQRTPGAEVSQSPLYQVGKGEGSANFTIYSQDIMVDEVQLMMTTSDQGSILLELSIGVEYLFYAHSITNIVLSPPSPATLLPGANVNITFDYGTTEANGVRIWARPFTNGALMPAYTAHGSIVHPVGNGSGTGWFSIPYGNVAVDEIRFQMYDPCGVVLLRELFIPVLYRYCDGTCVWHVDTDAPGANTGRNWIDAFNDLQDAFEAAAPGDKIKVAEGTYKPDQGGGQTPGDPAATFNLIDEVVIEGAYGGYGEADPDARDMVAYETILSGDLQGNDGPNFTNNADNSHHVVSSNISGGGAVLDGFTVTAGNALAFSPTGQGGGIFIVSGSPILVNCTFIRNKAGRGGGASNSNYGSDDPSFISCKFIGNSAGVGGGMESQGGEPTLTNCVFSGNVSTSSGGGLNNMGFSNVELTNCTLSGNSAVVGGGIYNAWATAGVEVLNCILWSNSDSGGSDESAQIHIDDGTVSVDYTCVKGLSGGLGGTGNIGDDPLFVDADGADNVVGTEDDNVHLLEGSPCIDTGHPAVQYQDIDGSRNDMGAYGGQFGEITDPSVYFGTGFIITNIGELPTTEIGRDANEPNVGLANVEPDIAALFGVPQYKDSPFGGTLRVRGQFGLYDDVDFYQMMLAKWVDGNEPAPEDYEVLDDEKGALQLGKVRWYVDANGWNQEYVRMGPKTIDGRDYLYQLNSPLDGSIWSNPDLRIRWNTKASENGLYTLTYKAYRWADPCQTTLVDVNLPPTDGWDHIILLIDNNPVTATIHNVKYDPCSPNYDDPCDGEIPECAIIGLTDANENLRFTITAKHANGYLRKWVLDALYGKNRYAGVIASDSYTPVSPPYWDGVQEQEYQSEDSTSLDPWEQCAYQFRLRAWARTTNGTNYVYSASFSDHYYLDFGVTTCMRADIDGSGMVDLRDAAELFNHYLDTCGP
ncbi:MAG: right-handed parallel beta-helix repeat-containing protein [Planctomycetes bacterium]|nr:right-handed parallel beta-helix repeat-containing protein [Planctomycetota bacterium]